MGRSRPSAQPLRLVPGKITVNRSDALPSSFIEYIQALPLDESAVAEPPPKRRRADADHAFGSMLVAEGNIKITKPRAVRLSIESGERHCAGNQLSLSLTTPEEYAGTLDGAPPSTAQHLRIRSTSTRKASALDISVKIGNDDLDDTAIRIFQVTNTVHALKSDDEGAFWTSISFRFRRSGSHTIFDIGLKVYWNETLSPAGNLRSSLERGSSEALISEFYPPPASSENGSGDSWSPMDFYEAAHVPNKEDEDALALRVPELTSELYPYQRRTLQWLLRREGVKWSATADGTPVITTISSSAPDGDDQSFREVRDLSGRQFYVSDLYQVVTKDPSPFIETESHLKGGILAEEMGLGKTLEIIGLILLHTRENGAHNISSVGDDILKPTGATLIVAPESLRRQWLAELERHAPYLRVKFYSGCGKSKASSETKEKKLVEELISQDVVVTTYSVLTSELHFAEEPPSRQMRHVQRHHRPRSPLVQISWWRVCLDEAQMIENGLSNAASVARLIPRVNAWGVTGTPVKSDVGDLLGLLRFLRYEPYASHSQIWQALVTRHKPLFKDLFSRISLRHTKRMVRDEISLPPQKRLVITVPFTAVEETFYQDIFKEMAEACGLDVNGIPLRDDWDPDAVEETMRKWLNRLRRTALHPQVGVQRYRGLGQKAGPIRTVDEVLDVMIEQSEAGIRNQQRAILTGKLTMGQLLENGPRVKEALRIWTEVKEEIDGIVAECRRNLKEAIDEARRSQGSAAGQKVIDEDSSSDEDAEEFSSSARVGEFRRRLRLSLEIQHRAVFFCANAYFQIKENKDLTQPESDEFKELQNKEEESYDRAKAIRREILQEAHRKATKYMTVLSQRAATQSFSIIPELVPHSQKGIESRPIIERLEELQMALNDQANKLDEWREHVIQLLTKPLVDEEDDVEVTGEEYTDSTQLQEELMVYVEALRAGIADRQDALSGQANELIRHEVKTARQQAKNEEGHAPELRLKLLDERDEVKPPLELGSFRGAISELRAINVRQHRDNAGPSRAAMENAIIAQQMKLTQAQLAAQDKSAKAMELEIDLFTSAMNARLEYYRQLQAISDSVAPYEGASNEQVITNLVESEKSLRRTLELSESKHRYLINLKESGSKSNEPRLCVICQSTFTIGVLTVCGHQFCKECIMLWFKTHHNCPMCKRPLRSSNLHDITLKPQDARLHEEPSPTVAPEAQKRNSPKNTAIYTEFSQEKLAEIQDIELRPPGFTTKVDAIVRHILWLRESDPGAKSIIFSQYRDFLNVLSMAFDRHHIGHSAIDKPNGITKFKQDPSTECFLLHARAHSSGLNLVDASHVFLCEPILNTALELQAIARVDRIGQQHETTVWLYIVQGTVEESIYNLSVQRRMEHMGRQDKGKSKESTPELLDASIEAANTLEMEQASLSKLMSKDRTAGEMVDSNDLWQCLFGHVSQSQLQAGQDPRLEDSTVVGFLSGEAAEERRRAGAAADGGSGGR